jgi:hypothetical protein
MESEHVGIWLASHPPHSIAVLLNCLYEFYGTFASEFDVSILQQRHQEELAALEEAHIHAMAVCNNERDASEKDNGARLAAERDMYKEQVECLLPNIHNDDTMVDFDPILIQEQLKALIHTHYSIRKRLPKLKCILNLLQPSQAKYVLSNSMVFALALQEVKFQHYQLGKSKTLEKIAPVDSHTDPSSKQCKM